MGRLFEAVLTQPLLNLLILFTVWIPGHSLGWGIILLTLLIRLILVPTAAQAIRQQQRLNNLQPELKEIQEKYKEDREQLAKEMMALYKRHDIHPLGACLPTLIQIPLLLALYQVFQRGLSTSSFHLLYDFVPRPEQINTMFLGIDLAANHQILLALLAGGLQYVQAYVLLKGPNRQQIDQNDTVKMINTQMLYLMPIMTVFISYSLPAALPLYWIVTTLFAIGQQLWLFRTLPRIARVTPAGSPVMKDHSSAPVGAQRHGNVNVVVRKKGS